MIETISGKQYVDAIYTISIAITLHVAQVAGSKQ